MSLEDSLYQQIELQEMIAQKMQCYDLLIEGLKQKFIWRIERDFKNYEKYIIFENIPYEYFCEYGSDLIYKLAGNQFLFGIKGFCVKKDYVEINLKNDKEKIIENLTTENIELYLENLPFIINVKEDVSYTLSVVRSFFHLLEKRKKNENIETEDIFFLTILFQSSYNLFQLFIKRNTGRYLQKVYNDSLTGKIFPSKTIPQERIAFMAVKEHGQPYCSIQ
jgi:hypothetical protein